MQYKIIVDKQSRTNPSTEKKEYIIDIEELRVKGDVYDSLIITKDEDYVMRRLKLSEYHVLSVLEEPIKQPIPNLNIELFEGDNYIYLLDMVGNKFYAEYLVKNDFTDTYVTRNEMNSSINQSAKEIDLTVNQKLEGYSTTQEMNSAINLKADSITSEVNQTLSNYDTSTEVSSKITQMANEIKSIVSSSITSPNLLLNSDFSSNFDNWDVSTSGGVSGQIATLNNKTWLNILNSESGGDGYYRLIQTIKPFTTNIKYTLSMLIKMSYLDSDSNTSMSLQFQFYDTNNNYISTSSGNVTLSNTLNEQKISITIQTPENSNISYCKMLFKITPKWTDLYMTNLQLEKGSVATDWNISQTEFYSMIQQTVNEINLEVGKKVGNDKIIATINMSSETVGIQANKINLTANDILNLIAGNAINLTSKNITITSDAFSVDKNGKVTCSNINITGGKISLTDTGNADDYSASFEIKQNQREAYYGSWGIQGFNNNDNSSYLVDDNTLEVHGQNGSMFWFVDSGKAYFALKNGSNGVYPILIQSNASIFKDPDGNTTLTLKNDGAYINGYKIQTNTSDKKLKKNINNSTINAIETIKKIQHKQFDWIENNEHQDIGYIAQELEKINSNYVHKNPKYDNNDNIVDYYYQVNILPLVATATKAIQEQQEIIENLKQRIEKLEAK